MRLRKYSLGPIALIIAACSGEHPSVAGSNAPSAGGAAGSNGGAAGSDGGASQPDDDPSGGAAPSTCSDGLRNGSESGIDCGGACAPCDPGPSCGEPDACPSGVCIDGECAAPECGDAVQNGNEACDDGVNDGAYGGCATDCTSLAPYCGDGEKNGDEACDDGAKNGSYGFCGADCTGPGPRCGDGMTDSPNERCDDSDEHNGTEGSCNSTCTGIGELCGNHVLDPGETCDISDPGTGFACDLRCNLTLEGPDLATSYDSGDASNEEIYGIAQMTDGSTLVSGFRATTENGNDGWVARFDSALAYQTEWTFTGAGTHNDVAFDVVVDSEDSFYVGGRIGTAANGRTNHDRFLRKYDRNGAEQWTWHPQGTSYPNYNSDYVQTVALDPSGYLLAGGAAYTAQGDMHWVRKWDLDLQAQWGVNFNEGTRLQPVRALAVGADGRVVVGGASRANSNLEHARFFLRQYDQNKNLMWSLNHTDEPGIGTVHAAVLDSHNHIFAVGHTGATDNLAIRDIRVAKYDESGSRQCEYVQSGPGKHQDSALGAAIAQDDGVYVTGFIADSSNKPHIWLAYFGNNCELRWQWLSTSEGVGREVLTEPGGSLVVGGYEEHATAGRNAWLARFCDGGCSPRLVPESP